jgi:hypothetical protein
VFAERTRRLERIYDELVAANGQPAASAAAPGPWSACVTP